METREICCVVCPKGCTVSVSGEDGKITQISGYTCPRGKTYAENEFIAPKRILTTTVKAEGYSSPVISVRSAEAIEKAMLFPCMQLLRTVTVSAPFEIGRVVVENILDTKVDIILTNC